MYYRLDAESFTSPLASGLNSMRMKTVTALTMSPARVIALGAHQTGIHSTTFRQNGCIKASKIDDPSELYLCSANRFSCSFVSTRSPPNRRIRRPKEKPSAAIDASVTNRSPNKRQSTASKYSDGRCDA